MYSPTYSPGEETDFPRRRISGISQQRFPPEKNLRYLIEKISPGEESPVSRSKDFPRRWISSISQQRFPFEKNLGNNKTFPPEQNLGYLIAKISPLKESRFTWSKDFHLKKNLSYFLTKISRWKEYRLSCSKELSLKIISVILLEGFPTEKIFRYFA